jgi:hypothetical protein
MVKETIVDDGVVALRALFQLKTVVLPLLAPFLH